MIRGWCLAAVLVLLCVSTAHGVTFCLEAASSDLAPSASASADLTHNDGGSHQYWTPDFDPSTDESIYLGTWFYPGSNPATMTPTLWWRSASGTSTNSVIWDVSIGCAGDAVEWDTLVFGTAQSVTDAGKATATVLNSAATSAVTPAGSAANVPCVVKINRDADNVSDDLAVDALLVGVCLEY